MKNNMSNLLQGASLLQNYFVFLLFLQIFLYFGLPLQEALAVETVADTQCCDCHNNICVDGLNRKNVHLPFLQLQCSLCHVYTDTATDEEFSASVVYIPDHLPMRSEKAISISVCTKCHAGFTHAGNHPVNIRPPEQVTIPDAFSIGPDGSITCVTCHATHASDYDYRMRFCYIGGNMKAGYYPDVKAARAMGGCFICHADKGVLPKKRKITKSFQ